MRSSLLAFAMLLVCTMARPMTITPVTPNGDLNNGSFGENNELTPSMTDYNSTNTNPNAAAYSSTPSKTKKGKVKPVESVPSGTPFKTIKLTHHGTKTSTGKKTQHSGGSGTGGGAGGGSTVNFGFGGVGGSGGGGGGVSLHSNNGGGGTGKQGKQGNDELYSSTTDLEFYELSVVHKMSQATWRMYAQGDNIVVSSEPQVSGSPLPSVVPSVGINDNGGAFWSEEETHTKLQQLQIDTADSQLKLVPADSKLESGADFHVLTGRSSSKTYKTGESMTFFKGNSSRSWSVCWEKGDKAGGKVFLKGQGKLADGYCKQVYILAEKKVSSTTPGS